MLVIVIMRVSAALRRGAFLAVLRAVLVAISVLPEANMEGSTPTRGSSVDPRVSRHPCPYSVLDTNPAHEAIRLVGYGQSPTGAGAPAC